MIIFYFVGLARRGLPASSGILDVITCCSCSGRWCSRGWNGSYDLPATCKNLEIMGGHIHGMRDGMGGIFDGRCDWWCSTHGCECTLLDWSNTYTVGLMHFLDRGFFLPVSSPHWLLSLFLFFLCFRFWDTPLLLGMGLAPPGLPEVDLFLSGSHLVILKEFFHILLFGCLFYFLLASFYFVLSVSLALLLEDYGEI